MPRQQQDKTQYRWQRREIRWRKARYGMRVQGTSVKILAGLSYRRSKVSSR